jgi:beta-galactosidase
MKETAALKIRFFIFLFLVVSSVCVLLPGATTLYAEDFTGDGGVGLQDFSIMALSWLSVSGEPDFNEICDLDGNGEVGLEDLARLTTAWLVGKYPYKPIQSERQKKNFNTGWKFYNGNPAAAFEHVLMDEAGTIQGENNWYFGVSTSNTGARDALMIFNPSWWNWMSCWVYPSGNSSCYISDDRLISTGREPHQYIMRVQCHDSEGYIPRIEWLSPHPDNSSLQVSFEVMSETGTQRFRILQNGGLVWESPDLEVWKPKNFIVTLPDVDNGDIVTLMQSSYISSGRAKWSYVTITENGGNLDEASGPSFDDSLWTSVILPYEPFAKTAYTSWPADTYEGIMWYRKDFALDSSYEGKKLFIEFESANVTADVWVNGTHLTTHYGGFFPFTVDVTDHVYFDGSENVIAVKVNSFEQADVPSEPLYGGINSDVRLHVMNPLHVTDAVYANKTAGGGIFVTYPSVSNELARVQVKIHVVNENGISKDCRVETYIVDSDNLVVARMASAQNIDAGGDYTFTQLTTLVNPSLWHPDHPSLYTVYNQVFDGDILVDDYETRTGIRSVFFSKEEGFKINGEPLKFRGANSNRGYPYIGLAVSDAARYRDVLQLKEDGFNYVRPSPEARPDDVSYLDACDELGLLVLDSIHRNAWQDTTLFKERCYQSMRDLIRRDRNHPCVIAWELSLNEIWWDAPEFSPTAMAIGHEEYPGDQCYVAAWKDSGRWGTEPVVFDVFIATPTAGAREYDGPLPLIISEHGHLEYVSNPDSTDSDVRRGEGEIDMLNQAWNHQESHHLNLGLANMCGDGVFCGTDYLAYSSGTIDKFRLPKFSYYFWQSQRNPDLIIDGIDSRPIVFIANYWTASSPIDVRVYSNCEEVKLYINDVLEATRTPDTGYPTTNIAHPPFTFKSLTWQAGELKAEGYIDGQLAATHTVRSPEAPTALSISFDAEELQAGGDVTFVYVSVLDSNRTVVVSSSNTINLGITGPAVLIGPDELDAEAGIAAFLLRATANSGVITVSATASGLDGDVENITSTPMPD